MLRMTWPMPVEKKSITGARSASKFMAKRLHHRKGFVPLPVKDGLNPTRVRVPNDVPVISAAGFLREVIGKQRHRHPDDGEAALVARFTAGEVVLRDQTVLRPDSPVRAGQDVWFYRMPAPERRVPFEVPVVYEDDDILVADKPPFMATMPRAQHITETATVRLRRPTGIDELSPAHRLDRMTAGLLLFTKRRAIRGAYQTLFARREVEKTYEAVAGLRNVAAPTRWASRMSKTPGELQGRIETGEPNAFTDVVGVRALGRSETDKLRAVHGGDGPLGLYTLQPLTGKTHQLRLHMWQAGVPILGDPLYPDVVRGAEDFGVPLRLKAVRLRFRDPLTGADREFRSGGVV